MPSLNFSYADMFGDSLEVESHFEEKPLLLALLLDFGSEHSGEVARLLTRTKEEINENRYGILALGLSPGTSPMDYMATGFNSPVGSAKAEDVAASSFGPPANAVFVVAPGGESLFKKTPATPADYLAALERIRAAVPAPLPPLDLGERLRSLITRVESHGPTAETVSAIQSAMWETTKRISRPEEVDVARIPEYEALLSELATKLEAIVGT